MSNGSEQPTRLERIEQILEVLLNRHLDFEDEHKKLLAAQVLLADAQRKTEKAMKSLAESQKHSDERLNALIAVVDGIIQGKSPGA